MTRSALSAYGSSLSAIQFLQTICTQCGLLLFDSGLKQNEKTVQIMTTLMENGTSCQTTPGVAMTTSLILIVQVSNQFTVGGLYRWSKQTFPSSCGYNGL